MDGIVRADFDGFRVFNVIYCIETQIYSPFSLEGRENVRHADLTDEPLALLASLTECRIVAIWTHPCQKVLWAVRPGRLSSCTDRTA